MGIQLLGFLFIILASFTLSQYACPDSSVCPISQGSCCRVTNSFSVSYTINSYKCCAYMNGVCCGGGQWCCQPGSQCGNLPNDCITGRFLSNNQVYGQSSYYNSYPAQMGTQQYANTPYYGTQQYVNPNYPVQQSSYGSGGSSGFSGIGSRLLSSLTGY
jgi:hypothetical protein